MRHRGKERRHAAKAIQLDPLAILPSHEVIARLVRLYFDTYENTYRILHRPTFWAEYGSGDSQSWSEGFRAIVLLMLATTKCLSTTETSFRDDITVAREDADRWISTAEGWLSRHSFKHMTREYFQASCLSLLAKRINGISRKQAWIQSGSLLRTAISCGLHLEPSDLTSGSISVFDQEMRRRLWAIIFEWDLEASMERGVPPMSSSISSDCRSPSNINDNQFDGSSQSLPEPRSLSDKTETSFLSLSLPSLPLRMSLTSVINDDRISVSFEEALQYEAKVNKELDNLPHWVKHPNCCACQGLPDVFKSHTLEGVLLDIQLRRYLIYLFSSFTHNAPTSQKAYSRMACMNAASQILEYHFKLAAAGNHSLSLMSNDLFTAIIAISTNMLREAQG